MLLCCEKGISLHKAQPVNQLRPCCVAFNMIKISSLFWLTSDSVERFLNPSKIFPGGSVHGMVLDRKGTLIVACHSRWSMHYISIYSSLSIVFNLSSIYLGQTYLDQSHCKGMMTSSNGNIFRVTGPLCVEFTGHRCIPFTKASNAELWWFLWSAPVQTVEQTIETLVIWDATALIMTSPCYCLFTTLCTTRPFHARNLTFPKTAISWPDISGCRPG